MLALQPSPATSRELTTEDYAYARLSVFHAVMFEEEQPAKHHRLLCRYLEAIDTGYLKGVKFRAPDGSKFNRFMCFGPPGMAKTRYVSHSFPAWYLGRNPRRRVMGCAHTTDYAEDNGGTVRDIVGREEFLDIFNVSLAPGSTAKRRWNTVAPTPGSMGQYLAAGVDKAIAGRRYDLGIIDDAIKDAEVADSADAREKIHKWYLTSFRPRRKPRGAIVIINTRWHDDDLCGRILPEGWEPKTGWVQARDGEWWFVLNIPALAEADDALGRAPGEGLWLEYFGQDHWEQERRSQIPRFWSALYQQRPVPESGAYFKREWQRFFGDPTRGKAARKLPAKARLRIYMSSDYATLDDAGDYTVHGVWAIDDQNDAYLLDCWYGQTTSDVWAETGIDMALKYEPLFWFNPKDSIWRSVGPLIRKRMRERGCHVALYELSEAGQKEMKARSFQGRVSMERVFYPCPLTFPHAERWVSWLWSQMLRFPAGQNDDGVDMQSIFFRALDVIVAGTKPAEPPRQLVINTAAKTLGEIQKRHLDKRRAARSGD